MGGSPRPPVPRWARLCLAALLVWTFALRLWHGSIGLDASRYFDEQFSMRNVAAILVAHELKPSNAFYPSLSYLPQTLVLGVSELLARATGAPALSVFADTGDGFSATAYLLSRGVAALFGALAVWALFALGCRLFNVRVGLAAALLLSVLPPHAFASAIFKPDVLVVLLVLIGFGWGLDAVEQPTTRRYAWAGVGIGLAVAAKYTGVGLAIPLTWVTLLPPGEGLRRLGERGAWGRLVLAGAVSFVTFAVLNPFLFILFRYIPRLWRIAEGKAAYYQSTPWDVFRGELRFLHGHHGKVVLALAIAGLVGLAVRAWQATTPREDRLAASMVLAYVVGYSALYVAFGKVFRGQNYIPVGAFTCLTAAWAAVSLWDGLRARLAWLRPRWLTVAAAAAAALALLVAPTRATYLDVVPSTLDLAEAALVARLAATELRELYYEREEGDAPLRAEIGPNRMLAIPVPRLDVVPEAALGRADGVVFPSSRLATATVEPYRAWSARPGTEELRFHAGFLAAHGTTLTLLLRPWQLVGEPSDLEVRPQGPQGRRFVARLPAPFASGEVASLSIWLPLERGKKRPSSVLVDGTPVALYEMRISGRKIRFLTPRVPLAAGSEELHLRFEQAVPAGFVPRVMLNRWAPSAAAPALPSAPEGGSG